MLKKKEQHIGFIVILIIILLLVVFNFNGCFSKLLNNNQNKNNSKNNTLQNKNNLLIEKFTTSFVNCDLKDKDISLKIEPSKRTLLVKFLKYDECKENPNFKGYSLILVKYNSNLKKIGHLEVKVMGNASSSIMGKIRNIQTKNGILLFKDKQSISEIMNSDNTINYGTGYNVNNLESDELLKLLKLIIEYKFNSVIDATGSIYLDSYNFIKVYSSTSSTTLSSGTSGSSGSSGSSSGSSGSSSSGSSSSGSSSGSSSSSALAAFTDVKESFTTPTSLPGFNTIIDNTDSTYTPGIDDDLYFRENLKLELQKMNNNQYNKFYDYFNTDSSDESVKQKIGNVKILLQYLSDLEIKKNENCDLHTNECSYEFNNLEMADENENKIYYKFGYKVLGKHTKSGSAEDEIHPNYQIYMVDPKNQWPYFSLNVPLNLQIAKLRKLDLLDTMKNKPIVAKKVEEKETKTESEIFLQQFFGNNFPNEYHFSNQNADAATLKNYLGESLSMGELNINLNIDEDLSKKLSEQSSMGLLTQ